MNSRLGALVLCMAVLTAAEYLYDDNDMEELNRRLERCLLDLPAVTLGKPFDLEKSEESVSPESIEDPFLLQFSDEVPVHRLRSNSRRVSPGDICRVQAMDLLWEDSGSLEYAVPALLECIYDYYKDSAFIAGEGLRGPRARAVQEGLRCVAFELSPNL